jgi:hypothetical protein
MNSESPRPYGMPGRGVRASVGWPQLAYSERYILFDITSYIYPTGALP